MGNLIQLLQADSTYFTGIVVYRLKNSIKHQNFLFTLIVSFLEKRRSNDLSIQRQKPSSEFVTILYAELLLHKDYCTNI